MLLSYNWDVFPTKRFKCPRARNWDGRRILKLEDVLDPALEIFVMRKATTGCAIISWASSILVLIRFPRSRGYFRFAYLCCRPSLYCTKWLSTEVWATMVNAPAHEIMAHGRTLRLLPYFMCANSEGSRETAPSLIAYVISTIISWAGSLMILLLLPSDCTDTAVD